MQTVLIQKRRLRLFWIQSFMLRAHENSSPHKQCASQHLRKKQTLLTQPAVRTSETSIGKALLKLSERELEKMKFLFNTAYTLAIFNKPFSDMEMMCELQQKNGVDIGENYVNKTRAREFISAIACSLQEDAAADIKASNFISVLADGSTDVSVREQEVVYVRYVKEGEVRTQFVSVEELESSNAAGVKKGIDAGLGKSGLSFSDISDVDSDTPTIVCANFDGASVMQGRKTGTMAMILEDAPWVVPMHCVAHKLELAALDSVKSSTYMKTFEDIVKGIFIFYHYSPKRRREVKSIAEILDTDLVHISGIKQVRWLASRSRALTALLQNLPVIITHLEDVASRKSSDESARAKGYLKELSTVKFVMMLHAMVDILKIISNLSKVFQKPDLLVSDVYQQVELHVIRLEELKQESSENLKTFLSELDHDTRVFKGVQLKGAITSQNFINDIVDDLMHYIDKRFSNFSEPPLTCFDALDYRRIPKDRTALMKYGKESLSTLLDHFRDLFPPTIHQEVQTEYTAMKLMMRDMQTTGHQPSEVHQLLLSSNPGSMLHMKKLLELMLVISPSTAECERGFSCMNLIKSSVRNAMNQESLQMLMTVKQLGPPLGDFCAEKAISLWMNKSKGGRHVHGHKVSSISSM